MVTITLFYGLVFRAWVQASGFRVFGFGVQVWISASECYSLGSKLELNPKQGLMVKGLEFKV